MKKIYIIFTLFGVITFGFAQSKATQVADKLFKNYEFIDAAKEYKKLVDKGQNDPYIFKQLGDCNYNIFNAAEAETWYAKAVATQQDAETYFRYAQMLKANKKYTLADDVMRKFVALAPQDDRAKAFNGNSDELNKMLSKKSKWDLKSIEINSKFSDFGAYLKDSQIYFSSARNTARRNYDWNDQPYLDIYKTDFSSESGVGKEAVSLDDLNTKHHEGTIAITTDGNTVYFSRESFFDNKYLKSEDKKTKFGKMYVYKANLDNGKWTNVTPLAINGKEFNTSAPSLSKDGKTLYFASDRPGGQGGIDIWKASISDNGSVENPVNMGKNINTQGNEQFPFVTDDNTLYFSSNGHRGLGGLDVFSTSLDTNGEIKNLGRPVNSEKDDFAFTFNQEKNIAFVSSNRDGGKGDDDIYLVSPVCQVDLDLIVKDAKTGDLLSNASIEIIDAGQSIATVFSNESGKISYELDCDKQYQFKASKSGYNDATAMMAESKKAASVEVLMEPIPAIVTETEVILNPIHFDFNRSNITKEGAFELDKLVAVMNQYPNMVIFAKSHTDSRGNNDYNLQLSERRAKATVQYVISRGIAAERISGQGFGETEPKVICDKCTEEEHAQNRRSEFMIVKK